MRDMVSEYGVYMIAVCALALLFWVMSWLPSSFKSFSQDFISGITGVDPSKTVYYVEEYL